MLLTETWDAFDGLAEEPEDNVYLSYIAQWIGYKHKSGKKASSRSEAGKMNRSVDLRSLGPMSNLLQMPAHVQKAAREAQARMRNADAG